MLRLKIAVSVGVAVFSLCVLSLAQDVAQKKSTERVRRTDRSKNPPGQYDRETAATSASSYYDSRLFITIEQPSVLRELKVTDEQKGLVAKLLEVTRSSLLTGVRQVELDKTEPLKAQWAEFERKVTEMRRQAFKSAEKVVMSVVLTESQSLRLQQIMWQQQAVRALLEDEVAQRLALTKAQRDDIVRLHNMSLKYRGESEPTKSVGAIVSKNASGKPPQETASKQQVDYLKLVRDTEDRMEKVLTAEQRKKWEELKGSKFEARREDSK